MEQRRKSSPDRQSESDVSWRKKGGGPCALVTPPVVVLLDSWSEVFSAEDDEVVAIIPSRIVGREDILIVILFVFVIYLSPSFLLLVYVVRLNFCVACAV